MWHKTLLLVTVASDILIGLAYFSIPLLLFKLWRSRTDFPFREMLILFAVFILACGSTHFAAAWNMWHADYWIAAFLKCGTALVSVLTAVTLFRSYSEISVLPSQSQLLQEIDLRRSAEQKLERVLAERTLERDHNKALMDDIVRALPTGLIALDDTGKALYVNESARTLLGEEDTEKATQGFFDRTSLFGAEQDDNGPSYSPLSLALEGTHVHGMRYKLAPLGGEPSRVLACYSSNLTGGGVVLSFQDVTSAALLERRLRQSNEELERFAHVASHDLKEPVRGVVGCLGLLQEVMGNRLEDEEEEFLSHALSSATRMREMIEGLLTYSSLGQELLEPDPIDCEGLVRSVLEDLHIESVELGQLPTVKGHEPLLFSLFHNLIGNAVKYQAPKRPLKLKIDFVDGVFRVEDNGQGIEARHQVAVFEVFRRLHAHSEVPGTGLGLALCKKIVDRHNGRIWVESVYGEGTTVSFTLNLE